MDAIHYDKIADKLINFHSKLPDDVDLSDHNAKMRIQRMKSLIDTMLTEIDTLANADERGWIR
jgi:hypothetical protein